jgi:hypothetical protein
VLAEFEGDIFPKKQPRKRKKPSKSRPKAA